VFRVSIRLTAAKLDVRTCFNASQFIKTKSLSLCASSTPRKAARYDLAAPRVKESEINAEQVGASA
jgi:hypothetical protein